MKRKTKVIIASVLGSILVLPILLAVALYFLLPCIFEAAFSGNPTDGLSWKHELPASITNVQEWAWADGFLPDYSYMLKAKVTQAEFDSFASKLKLTPHSPTRTYSENSTWLSWSTAPGFTNDWWDPSDSLETTFVAEGHDTWSFAKYENGYLYFQSLNH